MSALQNVRDSIQSLVARGVDRVRRSLFGANNERIDFLMDSFYKLSPEHQTGVLAGVVGMLLVFVLGAFTIYYTRINALEDELNASFDALTEVRSLSSTYEQELKRYQELKSAVSRSAAEFKPKPFFESKANQVGVQIADLRSQDTEIPAESPLAADFRYTQVEFKLPKVSLPRLLKFMEEVEKSGGSLNVHSLQIRTRYGDRLFFETSAKVIAYKTGG
jgi:hypothetical protein